MDRELTSTRAQEFVTDLDELHTRLRQVISDTQQQYQKYADVRRSAPPDFKIGDKVFVKGEFIKTTRPSKKLLDKYYGPYPIIGQAGSLSFILKLPDNMRAIHPVYHVSMLEPALPNTIPNRVQEPPPPIEVEGEVEYEIEAILDSKIDKRRRCSLLYLVKWSGYEGTDEETSWLPASELDNASEAVSDFHAAYPQKPGPLPPL